MKQNDCDTGDCDIGQRTPLSVEQALAALLERAQPLTETESVELDQAPGRVLARGLSSPIELPSWDNSAMDGYAIASADLVDHQGLLRVSQRIPAGSAGAPLEPGTAARIFTGAPVPQGADTVVVQEICEASGDQVRIPLDVRPGANIRHHGEDVHLGDQVLEIGTRLGPQHLGVAASVGVEQLQVYRRLRVAIFASGAELVMPGGHLLPGQIYNSNRFVFRALLGALGCEIIDLGMVPDDLEATKDALARGAETADLVMASGGVSVGEEDHVKHAVQALGSLDLWRVAMRPGKPLAFGHIGQTPFIGSPGNPVSLFVTFCLFARPFILKMQGVQGSAAPRRIEARADFSIDKASERREYHRARLIDQDDPGAHDLPLVQVFPSRSSAALTSLAWARGLVLIPEHETIAKGDPVQFIPFTELLA